MKEPKEGQLGRQIVRIAFDYVHDSFKFSSSETGRVAGNNDMQTVTVEDLLLWRNAILESPFSQKQWSFVALN